MGSNPTLSVPDRFAIIPVMHVPIRVIEKKENLWLRLALGLILGSIALIIVYGPSYFGLPDPLEPKKIVFHKTPVALEPSELNQYPPVMERAAPFIDRRIEPLREYLTGKNSPLAPYAEDLVNHYHYRLIIGIAFAESNFCKNNIKPHNCWGIGGVNPTTYPDYPQAISRADYYIQKYFDDGLTDLERFRNRWVGWQHPGWPVAVERVARELEEKGI